MTKRSKRNLSAALSPGNHDLEINLIYVVAPSSSAFRQVPVHERYGHCALANCGGTAFHRTVTNVTHSEETGNVGFQVVWITIERPAGRPPPVAKQVGTCHQV